MGLPGYPFIQGADLIHAVLPSSHGRVLGSWTPPAPLTGFQRCAPSEWLARLQRKCSMELPRSRRLKQEQNAPSKPWEWFWKEWARCNVHYFFLAGCEFQVRDFACWTKVRAKMGTIECIVSRTIALKTYLSENIIKSSKSKWIKGPDMTG